MASVVRVQDVIDAMNTVSNEHHAYLNRLTGELVTIRDEKIHAVEEEHELADYPGWQQEAIPKISQILNSNAYLPLSSRIDIHESSILERFYYEMENAAILQ